MQTTLKPLSGKRIIVTRPAEQVGSLSKKLQDLGAITIEIPTIEIEPPLETLQIDNSIRHLAEYDWLVFTSVHGVEFFLERISALKVPLNILNGVRVAAIGAATSHSLSHAGREPDYVPPEFLSERIVDGLGDLHGKRVLLPRADIASNKLPLSLRERGAAVDEIVAYRTRPPRELKSERLKDAFKTGVDVVTFTSPSTVNNFVNALGAELVEIMKNVRVTCIGPVTFEAAKRAGLNVTVVADPHTIDALVEAIVNDIGSL